MACRQIRLQKIGRIQTASAYCPCPHDIVDLIHIEDRSGLSGKTVHDLLEPFLKITSVLGSRQQSSQIQAVDPGSQERLRHVSRHYPPGKPIGQGRLSHPGLSYMENIILVLPAENLDSPLHLRLPAYERIFMKAGLIHVLKKRTPPGASFLIPFRLPGSFGWLRKSAAFLGQTLPGHLPYDFDQVHILLCQIIHAVAVLQLQDRRQQMAHSHGAAAAGSGLSLGHPKDLVGVGGENRILLLCLSCLFPEKFQQIFSQALHVSPRTLVLSHKCFVKCHSIDHVFRHEIAMLVLPGQFHRSLHHTLHISGKLHTLPVLIAWLTESPVPFTTFYGCRTASTFRGYPSLLAHWMASPALVWAISRG